MLKLKTLWKLKYLGCFSKAKTEESNQKVWNIFDQSGITILCSATYFLEIGRGNLLEVKISWKFRVLGCSSKAKTEECD